jgi:hypothetical protein
LTDFLQKTKKFIKKGIDFIEKLRYNVNLRRLDWETGGVTNAQH